MGSHRKNLMILSPRSHSRIKEITDKGNRVTIYTNTHFGKMISALYSYLAENNEEAITDVYELFKANFR